MGKQGLASLRFYSTLMILLALFTQGVAAASSQEIALKVLGKQQLRLVAGETYLDKGVAIESADGSSKGFVIVTEYFLLETVVDTSGKKKKFVEQQQPLAEISTDKPGRYLIVYSVLDKAGERIASAERFIYIDSPDLTMHIELEGGGKMSHTGNTALPCKEQLRGQRYTCQAFSITPPLQFSLEAIPATGWKFEHWENCQHGQANRCEFKVGSRGLTYVGRVKFAPINSPAQLLLLDQALIDSVESFDDEHLTLPMSAHEALKRLQKYDFVYAPDPDSPIGERMAVVAEMSESNGLLTLKLEPVTREAFPYADVVYLN